MLTLTISLSSQQIRRVQRAVETGAYASNSEVLREALRLWEQREEVRALELKRLVKAYNDGMASGPARVVTTEGLLAEFKKKAAKKAKGRG